MPEYEDTTPGRPDSRSSEASSHSRGMENHSNLSCERDDDVISDQSATSPRTRFAGVPTAAESRAFFQKQEYINNQVPPPPPRAMSAGSLPIETIFTPTQLLEASQFLTQANVAVPLDATCSQIPRDVSRWSDEAERCGSLSSLAVEKLERCQQLLQPPQQTDWRISKHPIGQTHPYVLLDAFLDAFAFLVATAGLLEGPPVLLSEIRSKVEDLSVCALDLRAGRTLLRVVAQQPPTDQERPPDPLQTLQDQCNTTLQALKLLRRLYLPAAARMTLAAVPLIPLDCSAFPAQLPALFAGCEATAVHRSTTRMLLASPQASRVAEATAALSYALAVAGEQRRSSARAGEAAVQAAVVDAAVRLTAAGRDFFALAAVTMPAASYEAPAVQEEFCDALLLSTYLTLQSMQHHGELSAFLQTDLPPHKQQAVRKRIKIQSTAVNAALSEDGNSPVVVVGAQPLQQQPTTPNATRQSPGPAVTKAAGTLPPSFVDPTTLTLCRPGETELLAALWMPNIAAGTPRHKPAAPADRINRLLGWLAWEGAGDLCVEESGTTTSERPDGEETAVAAVLLGARRVMDRLGAALATFSDPWTPRGEDVLALATRMLEALQLRLKGDARPAALPDSGRGITQRWRRALFSTFCHGSGRTSDGLVKLLAEFAIQRCCYVCPLQRWVVLAPPAPLMSRQLPYGEKWAAAVARDLEQRNAATARQCSEVGSAATQTAGKVAETGIQLRALEERLSALATGAVGRHSNQIKQHMDLIAALQGELRATAGRLACHQSKLELLTTDSRRLAETVAELCSAHGKMSVTVERSAAAAESAQQMRTECLAKIDALSLQQRSEWLPRLTDLHEQLARATRQQAEDLQKVMTTCAGWGTALQELKTQSDLLVTREEEMRGKVQEMRETLPLVMQTMSQAILNRAKRELQETVPALVQQLVAEALNNSANRPPAPRRSRLGFWAPSRSAVSAVVAMPSRVNDDEVSNAEETASVMEENAAAVLVDASGSWLPDGTTVGDILDCTFEDHTPKSTRMVMMSAAASAGVDNRKDEGTGSTTNGATPRRAKTPSDSAAARLQRAAAAATATVHQHH